MTSSISQFAATAPLRDGPVVVVGAGGMLGRAWMTLLKRCAIDSIGLDLPEFDMTDPDAVSREIRTEHAAVINCAAYTDVDGAEADELTAERLNAHAVELLARRCAETATPFVHFSTDYVFNGDASAPWKTDAEPDPINAYGRTKWHGEIAARSAGDRLLLVRTSWLYAPWGKNFVLTIARIAEERDELQVVDDQVGRPTSAEHLASTTWTLLERGARGLVHVTDGGSCSWYEFALEIVKRTDAACLVEPCATDQFPRPAARPRYSVLDLEETERLLGPMPHWRDNLAAVLERAGQPT
ncbi:MAG: dTDP-4-dehydrorhamnose reductase [Phycisphaerales bacterium]